MVLFSHRGWWQLLITGLSIVFKRLREYAGSLWLVQDLDVNVILGGNAEVTISSRVGWMAQNGSKTALVMEKVINKIFKLVLNQDDHCRASIEATDKHNTGFGRGSKE